MQKMSIILLLSFIILPNLSMAQNLTQINTDGFGDTGNTSSSVISAVYNENLYIGTGNANGCEIWRTAGIGAPPFTDWVQVNANGFGDSNNTGAYIMAVYNRYLYIGTENGYEYTRRTGCEVWRTLAVGGPPYTDWEQVNEDGFGTSDNVVISSMVVYNGSLYMGMENRYTGAEIWMTNATGGPPFTDWTQVNEDGFGDSSNVETFGLVVYKDALYAGTHHTSGHCKVFRYDSGTTWTQVNIDGFDSDDNEETFGMVVYNGYLHVGTTNETTGAEVWRTAALGGPPFTDWEQVNIDGCGDDKNMGGPQLIAYNNKLYSGFWNVTGGELWRTGAQGGPPYTDWVQIGLNGLGDNNNFEVLPSAVFNDNLILTTGNESSGCEIWQYSTKIIKQNNHILQLLLFGD